VTYSSFIFSSAFIAFFFSASIYSLLHRQFSSFSLLFTAIGRLYTYYHLHTSFFFLPFLPSSSLLHNREDICRHAGFSSLSSEGIYRYFLLFIDSHFHTGSSSSSFLLQIFHLLFFCIFSSFSLSSLLLHISSSLLPSSLFFDCFSSLPLFSAIESFAIFLLHTSSFFFFVLYFSFHFTDDFQIHFISTCPEDVFHFLLHSLLRLPQSFIGVIISRSATFSTGSIDIFQIFSARHCRFSSSLLIFISHSFHRYFFRLLFISFHISLRFHIISMACFHFSHILSPFAFISMIIPGLFSFPRFFILITLYFIRNFAFSFLSAHIDDSHCFISFH